MKLVRNISFYVSVGLGILFAVVFGILEGRTMLAGDWLLSQNAFATFMGYLLRFLLFIIMMGLGVFLLTIYIQKMELDVIWVYALVGLVIASFFTFIFYEWYIALAIVLGANFLLGASVLLFTRK